MSHAKKKATARGFSRWPRARPGPAGRCSVELRPFIAAVALGGTPMRATCVAGCLR
ncbi:protein of unknown function [Azospirillum lipoferum 4B]|uniref:Uncharacterized protein n=1 Tax=Azospirillum lipoferum (strain 4B) TaxID=862719 RepID=G7Z4E0_AZOL4|nr:protein of unknown function [Azospirillum lipoferum 4B]